MSATLEDISLRCWYWIYKGWTFILWYRFDIIFDKVCYCLDQSHLLCFGICFFYSDGDNHVALWILHLEIWKHSFSIDFSYYFPSHKLTNSLINLWSIWARNGLNRYQVLWIPPIRKCIMVYLAFGSFGWSSPFRVRGQVKSQVAAFQSGWGYL